MQRGSLPFLVFASPALRDVLGKDLGNVGLLALRAILKHRRSLEVAHQQIRYRKQLIAFSSRIGKWGDLIIDLDVGKEQLENVIVLESDLRQASAAAKARAAEERRNGAAGRRL